MQHGRGGPSCFEAFKRSRSRKLRQDAIDESSPVYAPNALTRAALAASGGSNPPRAVDGLPTPQFGPSPFNSPIGLMHGDAKPPVCSWNTQYTPDFGPSELKLDVGTLAKASEASFQTPEFGDPFIWQQDSPNCGAAHEVSVTALDMPATHEVNPISSQRCKLPVILGTRRRDLTTDKALDDAMPSEVLPKAVSSRPPEVPRLALPAALDLLAVSAAPEVETARCDFGWGVAQCYLCNAYPCLNRGCEICRLVICKHCFQVHKCTVVASMDDFIVVHELSTPRESPRSPIWSPRSERPSVD